MATLAAKVVKSWVDPRRPKPQPESNLYTSQLANGIPVASDKAASEPSPFWVGTHASARSPLIFTVAFIGSIVTCARNGV